MYNDLDNNSFCTKVGSIQNSTTLLINELATGEEIINQLANAGLDNTVLSTEVVIKQINEFKKLCAKAREAWALAVFSDSVKDSLERYFSFHLRVLSGLVEKLSGVPGYPNPECSCTPLETVNSVLAAEMNQLIDHVLQFFGDYPDKGIFVPLSYHIHCVKILEPEADLINQALALSAIPPILKSAVADYLDHLTNAAQPSPLTFRQLTYFQTFVKEIKSVLSNSRPCDLTALFTGKLLELEFNHLAIFKYFRDMINDAAKGFSDHKKLALLHHQAHLMLLCQKEDNERYDLRWPKLSVMLSKWLSTEIRVLKDKKRSLQIAIPPAGYKLKVEMSVAHLACLLRLFTKEGLFGAVQLTDLFKYASYCISTKRAETISDGGLSKSYYSVTQIIAAEVKEMLQKMIQRINRDYFPVMVAVSIIICAR